MCMKNDITDISNIYSPLADGIIQIFASEVMTEITPPICDKAGCLCVTNSTAFGLDQDSTIDD